ncbi:hypothetical protein [Paenibacillus eucommiae]|uniref:Uncharacterized protein n=1 Tax=Paenibacillus eucommiae TaxID=1355755 RepID=A0ABS4IUI3_9BACL|nr:hypothetical protein [Paenibacillus eucommiae]MBP1991245.1 hypothetical protein [Paenibacillus eucommiae]
MPFVLQHTSTSQIYTCELVNHYRLEYYGVKFWLTEEEAAEGAGIFLEEKEIGDTAAWKIIEMEEGQMKLGNVKLKNDPSYVLFWDEGDRPRAEKK